MGIRQGSATELGRREQNEDSLLADLELGLFGVADGIGGEPGGEVASSLAIDTVRRFFERNGAVALDPGRDRGRMDMAFRLAQREVGEAAEGPLRTMGTTLLAVRMSERRAVVAHVGDSRLYRLRYGTLERLTVDHTVREQYLMVVGETPPSRHYSDALTRAIAPRCDASPEIQVIEVEAGDTYLLCTDGVYKPLSSSQIVGELLRLDPADAARGLVTEAVAAGGRDNATAVVLRVDL